MQPPSRAGSGSWQHVPGGGRSLPNEEEVLFFPAENIWNVHSLSSEVPGSGRSRRTDGTSSGGSYASPLGAVMDPVTGRKDTRRHSRKKRKRRPVSLKEVIYGVDGDAQEHAHPQVFLDDDDSLPKPRFDWPGALYLDLSSAGTPWYRRPSIVWFRKSDLRVDDNPALQAAVRRMAPLLLVFILDEEDIVKDRSVQVEDDFEPPKAFIMPSQTVNIVVPESLGSGRKRVRTENSDDRSFQPRAFREAEPEQKKYQAGKMDVRSLVTQSELRRKASKSSSLNSGIVPPLKSFPSKEVDGIHSQSPQLAENNAPPNPNSVFRVWNRVSDSKRSTEDTTRQNHGVRWRRKAQQHLHESSRKWWLHYSLQALSERLAALGATLVFRVAQGSIVQEIETLVREVDADAVYFNRSTAKHESSREEELAVTLRSKGVTCYDSRPDRIVDVSTLLPFDCDFDTYWGLWKRKLRLNPPSRILAPLRDSIRCFASYTMRSQTLADLDLLDDDSPDNAQLTFWESRVGCNFARIHLRKVLESRQSQRVSLDTEIFGTRLFFGEISPRFMYWSAVDSRREHDVLLRSLCMREYGSYLRNGRVKMPNVGQIDIIRERILHTIGPQGPCEAWKLGVTGFPVIDAIMRQLQREGCIDLRQQTTLCLFAAVYLMLPWREGAKIVRNLYFEMENFSIAVRWHSMARTLFHMDENSPLHVEKPWERIFFQKCMIPNVRKYVPELRNLPKKYILRPWAAPPRVLQAAQITLMDYHECERQRRFNEMYDLIRNTYSVRKSPTPYPKRIVNIRKSKNLFEDAVGLFRRLYLYVQVPTLVQSAAGEIISGLLNGRVQLELSIALYENGTFVIRGTGKRYSIDALINARSESISRASSGDVESARKPRKSKGKHSHQSRAEKMKNGTFSTSHDETSDSSEALSTLHGPNRGESSHPGGKWYPTTLAERQQRLEQLASKEKLPAVTNSQWKREIYRIIAQNVAQSYELTNNIDRRTSRDSVRLCILKDQIRNSKSQIPSSVRVTVNHIKEFFQTLSLQVTGEWDRRGHGGVRGPYVYGLRPKRGKNVF